MEKEILEILKSIQETQIEMNNRLIELETKVVDELKSDLETASLITAKNWKDLAMMKARNSSLEKSIKNDNMEKLEVINYKLDRLDSDIIDIKNKINKNIK